MIVTLTDEEYRELNNRPKTVEKYLPENEAVIKWENGFVVLKFKKENLEIDSFQTIIKNYFTLAVNSHTYYKEKELRKIKSKWWYKIFTRL